MDLFRKAIEKNKSFYIPKDLMAPTSGAGEYATINCNGRRLGVGTRYQLGIIGRNRVGQILFAYSVIIDVEFLFPKSLNYKVTYDVDATISELCGFGVSTLIGIEHKVSGCDIFTDSSISFGMLATNLRGNFGKDVHWFLAMAAKVLWLNHQEVFGLVGHVDGKDNDPADGLSKLGKVKHWEVCAHCRREVVGFEARVEGWIKKNGEQKVIEGDGYEAHLTRFKKLVL